jgi:hypothetical protein
MAPIIIFAVTLTAMNLDITLNKREKTEIDACKAYPSLCADSPNSLIGKSERRNRGATTHSDRKVECFNGLGDCPDEPITCVKGLGECP